MRYACPMGAVKYCNKCDVIEEVDMIDLRKEVYWFAGKMEEVLCENEHKGGWDECSFSYLIFQMKREVEELEEAVVDRETEEDLELVISECCDVANFAMMIADKVNKIRVRARKKEDRRGSLKGCGSARQVVDGLMSLLNVSDNSCQTCAHSGKKVSVPPCVNCGASGLDYEVHPSVQAALDFNDQFQEGKGEDGG